MEDRKLWNSPFVIWLAIIIYIIMFIFIVSVGYFLITYILLLIAFFVIVINFSNLKFFDWFEKKPAIQKILLIFLFTLFLRFLLLFQDQVITRDIVMYVLRSKLMMAGNIPYLEFAVKKPPLYAYMLHLLGNMLGAGEVQFRAFFSIMDSVLVVIIYHIVKMKFSAEHASKAAFGYMICPIPIVAIGLAGHYEPVVMIFVMVSLLALFHKRYNASAFFLGLGFALKFFPLVLLPFFAWRIKSMKKKIIYILIFFIPIIITLIPILLLSYDAFMGYIYEQTYSWPAKKSFAFIFETFFGSKYIVGLRISLLTTVFFLGMTLLMFLSWYSGKFKSGQWFKIIVIIFTVYYGLFFMASMLFYQTELGVENPLPIIATFALVYFSLIYFLLDKYILPMKIEIKSSEEIFVLSAFSLFFLLFSSSQFNPWYFLWPLPFMFALENRRVKFLLLWLTFWNLEGLGIALLPGLILA